MENNGVEYDKNYSQNSKKGGAGWQKSSALSSL